MNQAQFYFLLLLLVLSRADWLTTTINTYQTLPLAILTLYHHHFNLSATVLAYILALSLNTFSQQRWIGHGDLDVIALGFALIPFAQGLNWLWLASFSQLGCHFFLPHRPHLPFLPALTFSWLIITIQ